MVTPWLAKRQSTQLPAKDVPTSHKFPSKKLVYDNPSPKQNQNHHIFPFHVQSPGTWSLGICLLKCIMAAMEYSAKDRENAPLALVSGTSEPPGNVLSTGTKVSTPAAKEWIHFKLAWKWYKGHAGLLVNFVRVSGCFMLMNHIWNQKGTYIDIYVIKHW